jgi:sarcosine oxidase
MYCTIVHNLETPGRQLERREVDVLVIGGGIVGAATALAAARTGANTALIERDSGEAATGSSKGGARIFAPAPYPDESYLEMGVRALERWRAIEAECGSQFLVNTGALTTGSFAEESFASLRDAGQTAALVSAGEAQRRFGVDTAGRDALHQDEAGIIGAARAHGAILALASHEGVSVHRGKPVIALEPDANGVDVDAGHVRYRCETAVVAAGPWSRALLAGAGIELPATVTAQTVVHLGLREPGHRPIALMDFDGDEPYALWDPDHGLKAALHARGLPVTDIEAGPEVDADAAAQIEEWARFAYPDATTGRVGVEACFYTRTPGERFVIQRHGPIVVVSACNGQGFQFAPETGEQAARVALGAAEGSSA